MSIVFGENFALRLLKVAKLKKILLVLLLCLYSSLFSNDVDIEFVFVENGTFTMGDTTGYNGYIPRGEVVRDVTLTKDFYIGKYEITQKQYFEVMGVKLNDPYEPNKPVISLSFNDMAEFCNQLSKIEGRTPVYSFRDKSKEYVDIDASANGYRLPTEAEWEYSAKGGNKSKNYLFSGSNNIDEVAWYGGTELHEVGLKKPNELGIYDMTGNVWEQCLDFDDKKLSTKSLTDPTGPKNGNVRASRGGGFNENSSPSMCRNSSKSYSSPWSTSGCSGFRIIYYTEESLSQVKPSITEGKEDVLNIFNQYIKAYTESEYVKMAKCINYNELFNFKDLFLSPHKNYSEDGKKLLKAMFGTTEIENFHPVEFMALFYQYQAYTGTYTKEQLSESMTKIIDVDVSENKATVYYDIIIYGRTHNTAEHFIKVEDRWFLVNSIDSVLLKERLDSFLFDS